QPRTRPGPARGRYCLAVSDSDPFIVAADRVVTPSGWLAPGWLRVAGGRIEATGVGEPPAPPAYQGRWALPGFIDMHVHGGGGASFTNGGPADARRAAAFHRAHGTTRIVASLVTAPVGKLEERVAMLAGLADVGVIDGIHLEGPFLSAARRGAQDRRYLTAPDVAAFGRLHAAGRGWLKMITIAPELAGALDVIRVATAAGVIAAAGHTDASAEVTAAAVAAGVSHATHLFNGMRPLAHRDPGPAGALLDSQVTCEVIADGTHLHDTVIRLAARAAGPGNLVLVTDAMAAAGMPDGVYRLGGLAVAVSGGVARLLPAEVARQADVIRQAGVADMDLAELADLARQADLAELANLAELAERGALEELSAVAEVGPLPETGVPAELGALAEPAGPSGRLGAIAGSTATMDQ